jgi:hypothetical protein
MSEGTGSCDSYTRRSDAASTGRRPPSVLSRASGRSDDKAFQQPKPNQPEGRAERDQQAVQQHAVIAFTAIPPAAMAMMSAVQYNASPMRAIDYAPLLSPLLYAGR